MDIEEQIKKCVLCREPDKSGNSHFFKAEFYQDYPSVILLRDRYKGYEYRPSAESELLIDCLSESFAITGYDCYATTCVKCKFDNKTDETMTESCFCQHCHTYLNSECAVLQPLHLIN